MSDDANVWIPDDLLVYYRGRAEADENIVDVSQAIRIELRKPWRFEEGHLEDPLDNLKLETITCCKCE